MPSARARALGSKRRHALQIRHRRGVRPIPARALPVRLAKARKPHPWRTTNTIARSTSAATITFKRLRRSRSVRSLLQLASIPNRKSKAYHHEGEDMSDYLVIDADGHCNEPDVALAKWMPKGPAHLAPNRVTDSSGYSHMMVEGRLAARRRWGGGTDRGKVFAAHIERSRPGMTDPLKRLPDMDQEGIDVAVIFGTGIAL